MKIGFFGALCAASLLGNQSVYANSIPIAVAGPDQTILIGDTTLLDGTGSFDPDGDRLTDYLWTIDSLPTGSTPLLQGADTPIAIFQPDEVGAYEFSLVVSDGVALSLPDTLMVTVNPNLPPIAIANADVLSGIVPLTVNFDGSQSEDPENRPLDYLWTFGDGGSSTDVSPSYTYQTLGQFTATLRVFDNLGQMDTDSLAISVNLVPVPPAVWLFGSGLLGLIGLGRRRKAG